MEAVDENLSALLSTLQLRCPTEKSVTLTRLQKSIATLHSAAFQSISSKEAVRSQIEHIADKLSILDLPSPITFHANEVSANTHAILTTDRPIILHVHSPSARPSFPHVSNVAESYLPISSHTEVASVLAPHLRDAVSSRKPITLIVFHLSPDYALLPALPVAHALADGFNARVHATGPACVSILRGIPLRAHSIGFDLAGWLGLRGCGHLTFGVPVVDAAYSESLFPPLIAMRYLLERCTVQALTMSLEKVVRIVEGLGDALYRVEQLWDVHVFAEGEAKLWFCGEHRRDVELAVCGSDATGLLELSGDGILVSATSALRRHISPPEEAVKLVCETLIRVTRQHELAKVARSAFIARLRQCEHAEVQPGHGGDLGTVEVVPLGHVPPAGRWRGDEDARGTVQDCTEKLVGLQAFEEVLLVIGDGDTHAAVIAPRLTGEIAESSGGLAFECELLAKKWSFNDESARTWGVNAAESVVQAICCVVEGMAAEGGAAAGETAGSERGPDGVVEVAAAADGPETEAVDSTEGAAEEDGLDTAPHASAVALWESDEEVEQSHVPTRREVPQPLEDTTQNRNGGPKAKPGFWNILFGDKNNTETDSSEDEVDGKELEDDYFRP